MLMLRALKQRSFALLWSGQAISNLGDSLYRVALAWWVLEKTNSATAMGTVLIFSFTPTLIFLLLGGVAVDRFPRLQVMLYSDLIRGLLVTVIALMAFSQTLEVWHIYIAGALFGFVDAFFQPAYVATVPDLTPPDFLTAANSLTVLSRQLAGVAGPAFGAGIVALGGTPVAFALDALSFFLSALCLRAIPSLPPVQPAEKGDMRDNIFRDVREGIGTVLSSPWLWVTISVAALANITQSAPFSVALPFLVRDDFHSGVATLGLISSSYALGFVLAAIWLGGRVKLRRRGLIAYGVIILSGLMTLTLGLGLPIPVILVTVLIRGFSFAAFELIWTNTLQELVPRNMLGRVASIDYLGSFGLLPIGYGLAGWLTDLTSASQVFLIGGAITVGLGLLALTQPVVRSVD